MFPGHMTRGGNVVELGSSLKVEELRGSVKREAQPEFNAKAQRGKDADGKVNPPRLEQK